MRIVKGFSVMNALASNTANVVGQFGELSTYALTFAKEKGYYVNDTSTDVQLVTFKCVDDVDAHLVLINAVRDYILSIQQWVYDQFIGQLIPGNASIATFTTTLEAAFPDLTDVVVGTLVQGTQAPYNGVTYNMPQFVEAQYNYASFDYTIKIWFSDAPFRAQYDEYEIEVINPLVSPSALDDLQDHTAIVGPMLAAVTPSQVITQMNTLIGTNPPTMVRNYSLTWYDPNLPASTLSTTWTLIIWGAAGDNADNMKDAIKNFIEDTSALTLVDWQVMYPDLYNDTEFAIIPLWDYISSPETMMDYGLYSPTVRPNQMQAIALNHAPPNYGVSFNMTTHTNNHLQLSQSTYRSIPFLAVSYPGNPNAIFKFSQKFSDYMAIPPSNPDFNRMSLTTRDFVTELVTMLNYALDLTPADPAPPGYQKIVRSGKVYVGKEYDGTLYLVLTKHSYLNP